MHKVLAEYIFVLLVHGLELQYKNRLVQTYFLSEAHLFQPLHLDYSTNKKVSFQPSTLTNKQAPHCIAQAIYNQLNTMTYYTFKESLDFKFIGYIRDLANDNVNSILGTVYYTESNKENFAPKSKHELYEHKWYNKQELINRYGRATSWSKIIIDMIVDESIKEYI